MRRFLMLALFVLIAAVPQAWATDPPGTETEKQPEVQSPAVEDLGREAELAEVNLLDIFGGLSFLVEKEEPQGLCIICPLSYCRRVGLRCDYTGCPQETCCNFSCYYDASCTSGNPNCSYFDCGCRRIIIGP